MDIWQVNPASFIFACGQNDWRDVLRRNGIAGGVQSQEVCRITKDKAWIDNTDVSRQTSFGGVSEEILES